MNQHAKDEAPTVVLMAHYSDDTLDVVCHWHHDPSEAELDEMIDDYLDELESGPAGIGRFILSTGLRSISIPPAA